GRVPMIVGASATDVEATLRHLTKAKRLGAAAAMVMAPARLGGDAAGLIEHYRRIGEAAAVPIMLQNAPPPAGGGFDATAVAQVVAHVPAVRYVKEEAMPCGQRITALLARPEIAGAPHFAGVLGGAGARRAGSARARHPARGDRRCADCVSRGTRAGACAMRLH